MGFLVSGELIEDPKMFGNHLIPHNPLNKSLSEYKIWVLLGMVCERQMQYVYVHHENIFTGIETDHCSVTKLLRLLAIEIHNLYPSTDTSADRFSVGL